MPLDFLKPTTIQQPPSEDMKRFLKTGSPAGNPEPLPGQTPTVSTPEFLAPAAPAAAPQPQPYDWKAVGMDLPDWMQPVGDLITGMNTSLSNITGIALDDIDIIMRDLGTGGLLEQPGTGREKVIAAMEAMGIGADRKKAATKFLADIGESTGENLLMLSAFMAAAPMMMSAQGPGMLASLQRNIGQGLIKYPGTAASAEIGSAALGETGAQIGAQVSPLGEQLGGVAGALGGGVLGAIGGMGVGGLVRGAKQGVEGITNMVKAATPKTFENPLLSEAAPDVNLISQAIKSDQLKMDRIIERLTSRMTQNADPIQTTKNLQRIDRQAYKEARRLEAPYWAKANTKRTLQSEGLKTFAKGLVSATAKEGRSEWLPGDLLSHIRAMPQKVSIERMRAVRTMAFQRLQSGTVPTPQGVLQMNDTLRRNLNSMIHEIDKEIELAYPNDIALKEATSFSRWIHDKFTRGPVAQFARTRSQEGQLPPATKSAKGGMRDETFGQSQADIAQKLEIPQLEAAAQQFLRGRIAAEVERLGPKAGPKFLNSPQAKSFLKAYPRLMADLESNTNRLTRAIDYNKEVLNSAFIKAAAEGPETAIKKAISTNTRVRDSKALYDRLKHDPDALAAAKNQTILELERMAGGDPSQILNLLDSPDTYKAVQNLIGDDMGTLVSIARQATQLMQVEKGLPRYSARRAGRFIGAWVARKAGSRTIQGPGVAADIGQKMVDMFYDRYEKDIFSKAIRYPAWRAILNSRIPETTTEVKRLNALIKRAIRVEEAAERSVAPLMDDEDAAE